MMPTVTNLDALGARLAQDLETVEYPPKDWVIGRQTSTGTSVTDVVIIGAGMCGLAAAFTLKREGISNIRIFDAHPAGIEGPWLTYARMETLRSPKHLAGPAMGLPNLTFRAWYESQFGTQAWAGLGKIPRPMWMAYLNWYRQVLELPVENDTSVEKISPADHGFDLSIHQGQDRQTIAARRIVLATGREGMARPRVPAALAGVVGPHVRHSSEDINFREMRGRDVAIIGFSASAIDNAAEALEAGAKKVHILVRAPEVSRINKMKSTNYPGFTSGFPGLPVAARLELLSYVFRYRVAPPRDSILRVFRHSNVALHLNAPVDHIQASPKGFNVTAGARELRVDQIIYCTGFRIDTAATKEMQQFAPHIRTFRESVPDNGDVLSEFLDFPDLGPGFEFQQKQAGVMPSLSGIHNFTFAATVSHGNVSGDIPCVSDGAMRLAKAIAATMFQEDFEHHLAALHSYEDAELFGDEIASVTAWKPAVL